MYRYIHGSLEMLAESLAVVEAAGVGYALNISGNTREKLGGLSEEKRKNVRLYTHLSVREDGVELFGFYTDEELEVFRLLISVSGVGPKAAMAILSFMTPEKLAFAVATGDQKAISKAPGVGPKTAARIVLELKDKLRAGADAGSTAEEIPASALRSAPQGRQSEAVDALVTLGFTRNAAAEAVKDAKPDAELEDIIREALKKLMR